MRWLAVIPLVLGFTLIAPARAMAAPPPYYPPITWIPASSNNYDVGRTQAIRAIVIHETDGSYLSAVNWFQNPRSQVSAHYLVRAWGGGITQFVAEGDTAYHARVANPWSIGIEHEFNPRQAIWHTDAQYRSSALLVCAIAKRYGIPTDRAHIIGHNEVPGTDHTDPGPTWNWTYYMSLVRSCSVERAQAVARASLRTVDGQSFVPSAGLEYDNISNEVALLQWDLAYLGFLDADEVGGGGNRFGPLTQDAVTAFQQAHGIEATGTYGDQTATALVQALAAEPADVPVENLDVEAESDEVARLQTVLQRLGYMDLITGYYGQITTDAVTRFQEENGIDATGAYGPITRMALAARLRASLVHEVVVGEVGEVQPLAIVAIELYPY